MSSKKFFSKVTEPIDQWLEAQGLYRKHTAHDPSCLFRAVAEQIYYSQCCHEIVRKQCVHFMAQNKSQFEKMVDGSMENYILKLSDLKEWGSHLELNAMSLLYQREIIVFEQSENPSRTSINNVFRKCIMLCFSSDNHYDSVYPKSYIMKAAFCQSVVYEILYKNVFCLVNVDFAVDKMLHKSSHNKREHYIQQNLICASRSLGLSLEIPANRRPEGYEEELNVKELLLRGITPFPYKVAKALDPDIYRNIEFDVWGDLRREMKLGIVGGNSDELQVGVKCLVKMQPDRVFHAHIQEMEPNNGPVIVFVEELGKKCTVSHDVLEPLPKNQKVQWALPYKHQRHLSALASKSQFLDITELSSKWRKNKYNKTRKLKDMFMPPPMTGSMDCPSSGHLSNFHQDPSQGGMHYPMDHFSYNQSNLSVTSSEDCSNESSQIMQADSCVNGGLVAASADSSSSSSTAPVSMGDSDQSMSNICNPPLQIVGVPMYHSLCPDSSGARVSAPVGAPIPSYVLCNGNPQGRMHSFAANMDNFTVQPVNFYAQKSVHLNGSDLPFSDVSTLRFYYNLGHDYFRSGYMMWQTTASPYSTHLPPSNSGENNPQLPDSTVPSEEDSYHGPKVQNVQTVPVMQQQHALPHGISQTVAHPIPVSAQVVPQITPVPQVTSAGILPNMIPQVVPVSTPPHAITHPSSHKMIQHPSQSPPPQHTMCATSLPQTPPVFTVNNMWTQQSSPYVNQQRINVPESETRTISHPSAEDSGVRGTDAKNVNSCHANVAVHSPIMDSYTHSPVYPYYVVEMDSVPVYNPYSYVMQPSSDMDVVSSSQMHTVPSSVQTVSPVLYHSPNVPHGASVPHWISSDGVPQYAVM